MAADEVGDQMGGLVGGARRDQRGLYAPLDQQLGGAPVEGVEVFDDPGLYGPLAVQALVESFDLGGIRIGSGLLPGRHQGGEVVVGVAQIGFAQGGDGTPDMGGGCFGHGDQATGLPGCGRAGRRAGGRQAAGLRAGRSPGRRQAGRGAAGG